MSNLISPAQLKCINYHLWQLEKEWSTNVQAKLEALDRMTASDIVSAFKAGNDEIAISQLNHLDIPV